MQHIKQIIEIIEGAYNPEDANRALDQIEKIVRNYKTPLVRQLIKSFGLAKKRNWDKIYVVIDIHETVLKPTWSEDISTEYYDFAKETLQLMSKNNMLCLILWTSSLSEGIEKYLEIFRKDNIKFDFVNKNPECENTKYADFKTKLYMSMGMDDKFGFIPEDDWEPLFNFLKKIK